MNATKQDSATRDGDEGIARRVKDCCDKAMTNLKAERFKEAYLFANESLELDGKDAKATAIYRYALYTLHPKKRLLDKAKTLHEEADQCMKAGDYDKGLKLVSLAKKWHCTPGVLWSQSNLNISCDRFDLAYLDATEALGACKRDERYLVIRQGLCLRYLGYNVLPVMRSDPREVIEMPARYQVTNWPKGLRLHVLYAFLWDGYALAVTIDGATLKPYIPLDQLGRFLNDHVQGSVGNFVLERPNGFQGLVMRLLDEVAVSGRLHVGVLSFADFFHLPWASIERILDGRTLRGRMIDFIRLELPSGVDANKLLKLPGVRECMALHFQLYSERLPQLPGPPPLFDNAALVEWIKRSDGRILSTTSGYLSSGPLSFLDALKKVFSWTRSRRRHCLAHIQPPVQDFQRASEMHSYQVKIHCPRINVVAGLGVRNEALFNRLGEKMMIGVSEDPRSTVALGHRSETVFVLRLPPS